MRRAVLVRPRSAAPGVGGSHDGLLVVRVAEPATDGRANRAVVEAVATALGVPRRTVAIVGGVASRRKLLEVDGDGPTLAARWDALAAGE